MNDVNFRQADTVYLTATEAEEMKKDLSRRQALENPAIFTSSMKITGDVTADGSLTMDGQMVGNIDILGRLKISGGLKGDSQAEEIITDNAKIEGEIRSKKSVVIGQNTVVIGNIFANNAVINGAVKGNVDVHGPVILDTTAIVMGNIRSKTVQIHSGAVIEGMCTQDYADISPTSFFADIKKS